MRTLVWGTLACCALLSAATASYAQDPAANGSGNTTLGYGDGKILKFNYTQNYVCTNQPKEDLNFNGLKAAEDPSETNVPICQAGTNPTINPPGQPGPATKSTDPIYVLVPMFSVNNDQNPKDAISCKSPLIPGTICGAALGKALIGFFGALPEGFKENPMVYTQCPNPGLPAGTCTMHSSRVDLAPVLATLGYINNPPTSNVFVPSPNHSHVLTNNDINLAAEWWQVLPVLVLSQADWPPKDGSSGITSVAALKAAEQAGDAVEAPSNFFLYFGSKQVGGEEMNMGGMQMGASK